MPPSDSNREDSTSSQGTPLSIEDIIEAANAIRSQGIQPNTIILSPEIFRDLVSIDDIVQAQPMAAPTRTLFWEPSIVQTPADPVEYTQQWSVLPTKNRWELIMEEINATQ